tara:strand:+ start:2520 stop:2762 length:243 start_codon:yes stop_codon:yes gene_type:complete
MEQTLLNKTQQKFPENVSVELSETGYTTISYTSPEMAETPFGVVPVRTLSVTNETEEGAYNSFMSSLETNGYNFETNIWQ